MGFLDLPLSQALRAVDEASAALDAAGNDTFDAAERRFMDALERLRDEAERILGRRATEIVGWIIT